MSNEELIEKIRNGEDVKEHIEELYLQNEALIGKIAYHYTGYENYEDLKQEGFLGLMTALELWSPEGGASFSSYAYQWIKQTMRRYIENCGALVRLPSRRQNRLIQYNKSVEEFRQMFMKEPTSRELAYFLGISPSEVETIRQDAQCLSPRSISEPIGEDGKVLLGDTIESDRDDIGEALERIQSEELSSLLWSLVDELQESESAILRKRYKEGRTFQKCGEDLGISGAKARQIELRALRNMRKSSVRKKLEPYVESKIVSLAYQATGLQSFQNTWTSAPESAVLFLEERRRASHKPRKSII